jgi:hypothetical protein
MKRNITKTDLRRLTKKVLNEQGTPATQCIDPSTITYNTPQGVACLCFFDIDWSQGHQYGGHIEIEGCMQPNSNSTLSIYVNDDFRASTSALNTSYGANILWGNANTSIIRVKVVMECTGSHPACSAQNIEKTICVRKSDGQKVPCRKTMPKGELMKHDDSKATAINYGGPTIDSDLESRDDAEDIRESRLDFIIKKTLRETIKVLNEAPGCSTGDCPTGQYCSFQGAHLQDDGGGTCIDGTPPSPFPWGGKTTGGRGKRPTVRETTTELNEAPNCWYRRRNYANNGYTCVVRKCGFNAHPRAFLPGEYSSEADCGSSMTPVGPGIHQGGDLMHDRGKAIGGGSGFAKPQGGSDRLEKFKNRQKGLR